MDTKDKTILVTGATGHQGGAVVRHLLNDGWKVRGLTRYPSKPAAQQLVKEGIDVVEGDLSEPASLDKALENVYGVFSVQQPLESGVDEEVKQGKALADAARRMGVRHFVYSSIGCADENTGIPFFESKAQIEKHVKNLGMNWTIVRPVFFMENFLSHTMRDSIENGVLSLALDPDNSMQFVAVDDIGEIVALVFNDPEKYKGKTIEIAGDELTGTGLARKFSNALGNDVRFHQLPIRQLEDISVSYAMMFDWMNKRGFKVDIDSVRSMYPGLRTFDRWIRQAGWYRKAA